MFLFKHSARYFASFLNSSNVDNVWRQASRQAAYCITCQQLLKLGRYDWNKYFHTWQQSLQCRGARVPIPYTPTARTISDLDHQHRWQRRHHHWEVIHITGEDFYRSAHTQRTSSSILLNTIWPTLAVHFSWLGWRHRDVANSNNNSNNEKMKEMILNVSNKIKYFKAGFFPTFLRSLCFQVFCVNEWNWCV